MLHFTTDAGPRAQRTWQSLPAVLGPGTVSAPVPPDEANTWYIALTDARGAMVSTPIQFRP